MRKCTFKSFVSVPIVGTTETKKELQPFSGQFHAWTRDVNSAGKIVPKAIVEDDDGSVYLVPPHVVKFTPMTELQKVAAVTAEQELVAIAKRIEGRFNAMTIGVDGFLHQMHTTFEHTCSRVADIIYSTRR